MKTEFQETQRIGNWIYILLSVDLMVVSLVLYNEVKTGKATMNGFLLNLGMVLLLNVFIVFFIRICALYTKVSSEGVSYKYPPFCMNWKLIPFEKINSFQIQNYSSLNHGYSVGRWNWFSKTDRITSMGTDKAILIDYNAKKPILIGSHKTLELYNAIKKFKNREYEL